MTRLILVRHGEPDVPRSGPTSNPPLSQRGAAQSEQLAAVLAEEPITRIWSSGMIRADATAAPLAARLSKAVTPLPGLGEIDRWGGDYANIELIREKGRDEWRRFLADPLGYFGVDAAMFRSEALEAFAAIIDEADDDVVVAFTHGFPINILLSHCLKLDHDARFAPAYGSFTRLSGRSIDGLSVVSVNETGHLPGALR